MPEPSPLAGFVNPESQAAAEGELCPAKIGDRFVAFFLDWLPFVAGWGASLYVTVVRLHTAPPTWRTGARLGAAWLGLMLLYQFVGNLAGGTVGKRLMGLKVVRRDGTPLGLGRSLVRTIGYLLSIPLCNFGFLIAFFHPETRTLHDVLSGALVVEARAKNPAESFILFLAAVCAVTALFVGNIYYTFYSPLPEDIVALQKAREGLKILARIEDSYKARSGAYTDSLPELAAASGDQAEFQKAMLEIFDPHLFRIELGVGKYRISAAALDRAKTRVFIIGPLPDEGPSRPAGPAPAP